MATVTPRSLEFYFKSNFGCRILNHAQANVFVLLFDGLSHQWAPIEWTRNRRRRRRRKDFSWVGVENEVSCVLFRNDLMLLLMFFIDRSSQIVVIHGCFHHGSFPELAVWSAFPESWFNCTCIESMSWIIAIEIIPIEISTGIIIGIKRWTRWQSNANDNDE